MSEHTWQWVGYGDVYACLDCGAMRYESFAAPGVILYAKAIGHAVTENWPTLRFLKTEPPCEPPEERTVTVTVGRYPR